MKNHEKMVHDLLIKMRPKLYESHKTTFIEVYKGKFNNTKDMVDIITSQINQAQENIDEH